MKEDIIKMAREAGLAFDFDDYPHIWQTYMNVGREEIEHFFHAAYAAGAAAEREECAKVVEIIASMVIEGTVVHNFLVASAAKIRARGQQ